MEYVIAVLAGLGLAEVATLITTIYLHRVLSHKAIRLHPALTMFMRFGTWMLTSISPREWVAVHRKHHNFSDVEGDPHSPHIEGYWKIMLANVYYYRREANKRRYPGEVRRRSPLRPPGQDVSPTRHPRLLPDGRDTGPAHGLRAWPRGACHARGRVPGAERRDQRRGPHLRLQELRERRDKPQAAGPDHLRRGPAQQPPRTPRLAQALRFRAASSTRHGP